MKQTNKAFLYMHIATFLFGMTAIIGKLITLNEFNMVWHRMLITSFVFLLVPTFWKNIHKIPKKIIGIFFLNGVVVALHWLTFYGSIKINNNASLTLACFGSVSTMASVLEPLILKQKFKKSELLLGMIVLVGLVFIAFADPNGKFDLGSTYFQAIILALVSSFFAIIFTIINKKYIQEYNPIVVTWARMTGGFLFLTLMIPFVIHNGIQFQLVPSTGDGIWLIILAVLCTNIAFSLEIESLKKMSAFTSSIILNLEPVYGIFVAIFLFKENEMLNQWFYIGASIVIISVFAHAYFTRKITKAH
jgi:drug/metabolite transporter (DMT)-like permease